MYTMSEWNKDKVLVHKLIIRKRYDEARNLLNDIFIIIEFQSIKDYISGMLFMLDLLHPEKKQ